MVEKNLWVFFIKIIDDSQRINLRTNRSQFNNDDEFGTNTESGGSDFILKNLMKNGNKYDRNKHHKFNDHLNQPLLSDSENG